jgi:hypothetical protein
VFRTYIKKKEGKEKRSNEASSEGVGSEDSERVISERVANEIKRKHQVQLSIDDSLDVKSGVILGFIVLILVQVILSGEITAALSRNISLLLPYASTTQYGINLTAFLTFSGAFLCLILAAITGMRAISIRPYKDADIDVLFDEYRRAGIDDATFDTSIVLRLQLARKENKASSDKKAARTKNALLLLAFGVALLIVHFLMIVISTAVLS